MSALQESRRELMVQLEGLMKLLKVSQKRRTSSSSPLRNSRSLLRDASLLSYPYKYPVRNRGICKESFPAGSACRCRWSVGFWVHVLLLWLK